MGVSVNINEPKKRPENESKRDVVWHIYHTILALLLAGVLIVEIIELWIK
jgi:hypothetical protein